MLGKIVRRSVALSCEGFIRQEDRGWSKTLALAALLGAWSWGTQAIAAGAQYVYDSAGRLVQVIAPNGSSAQYSYDAAGNITSIQPIAAVTLAETGTSASSGTVGSTITIYGSGFSSTPGNNTAPSAAFKLRSQGQPQIA